jgi:hypothetical protein
VEEEEEGEEGEEGASMVEKGYGALRDIGMEVGGVAHTLSSPVEQPSLLQ